MNSISIIGCGWLGFPLATDCVKRGFTVKGSTTSEDKLVALQQAGIQPFLIRANEVLEGENLDDFFDSEILIINIPPRRRRPEVETLHVQEVKNILDAAAQGNIQRLIFCGSTGVYSDNNAIARETDQLDPQTSSTKALAKIEEIIPSYKEFQTTILRFSGLVGGDRKAGRFLAGKKEVANGNAIVNLVHREDCIGVIHEVIRQKAWGEVFNVCADEHPTREAFYTQQALKQGFEPPTFKKNDTPKFKIVSNQKLKEQLNYTFLHPKPSLF